MSFVPKPGVADNIICLKMGIKSGEFKVKKA